MQEKKEKRMESEKLRTTKRNTYSDILHRDGITRNYEQLKETPHAVFFTGTVSPQRYEYICKRYGFKNDGSQDNKIITKIHRLFLERIRKQTRKSVKHWCVTEKGHTNTRRIHLLRLS